MWYIVSHRRDLALTDTQSLNLKIIQRPSGILFNLNLKSEKSCNSISFFISFDQIVLRLIQSSAQNHKTKTNKKKSYKLYNRLITIHSTPPIFDIYLKVS